MSTKAEIRIDFVDRWNSKTFVNSGFEYFSVSKSFQHCVKSVQIRSYFWFVFSCIRIEYGDLLRKSPYSIRMQENTDQKQLLIWTLFTECKCISIFAVYLVILKNFAYLREYKKSVQANFKLKLSCKKQNKIRSKVIFWEKCTQNIQFFTITSINFDVVWTRLSMRQSTQEWTK